MAKLTDKQKKEIIAYYVECQNYSETGRKFNLNESTIRSVVKNKNNNAKEITEMCEQKNNENTEDVLKAMKKRAKTKIKLMDKIFEAMDGKLENIDMFTNIKDLATAYGIIMDKELKIWELELKKQEISKPVENIQRVEIINTLPKDDDDGNN